MSSFSFIILISPSVRAKLGTYYAKYLIMNKHTPPAAWNCRGRVNMLFNNAWILNPQNPH